MPPMAARSLLGLSFLALAAGVTSAKSPPADRIGVVDTLIHEIQGNDLVSPLRGTRVTTAGVVTAVVGDGYFLQTLPGDEDADAGTSEGLFVLTGNPDPAVAVGQQREVQGLVEEALIGDSPHQLTLTRLVDTQSLLIASGLPLPEPVAITAQDLSPDADVDTLERFEGMRVSVARLLVFGPTGAAIDPASLTASSNGIFHAVWGQTYGLDAEPPLREPGLSLLHAGTPPPGKNLALHDANPEVLRVDSRAQPGAPLLDLGRNDRLRDAVGVLGYEDARYSLLIDPVSTLVVQPRPRGGFSPRSPVELRMAWVDLGELFDASDDPGLNEPVPSPAGHQARLDKIAVSLCRYLVNPEVIAVNGAENLQVLQQLATTIETNPSTFCPEPRQYQAVLVEGSHPSGLDVGFLVAGALVDGVNPRVKVLEVTTFGATESSAHPAGGSEPLHPALPLVARLLMTSEDGRPFAFTAVNVRLRELDGADSLDPGSNGWSTEGERIMSLRARQAASIAAWLEARQQANPDEAIAVLGGFDADPFNDGRVDVMGIVTGKAAPADRSWVSIPSALTSPLTNLTLMAGSWSQYNATERGDLRGLDHILVNEAMQRDVGFVYGSSRFNADFPAVQQVAMGGNNHAFSARDPRLARMAVKSFIDADTRVVLTLPAIQNPNYAGSYTLAVANAGPDFAPLVVLEVHSTLSPAQWGLSAKWPGWFCGPITADAMGSRAVCRHDGLREVEYNDFYLSISTHSSMEGTSATFVASVNGAHGDPDPTNNQRSATVAFDSSVDLYAALSPLDGAEIVAPGSSGGWAVDVKRTARNHPGQVQLQLDIDADPGEVSLGAGAAGLGCDTGTSTGYRRSRYLCSFWSGASLDLASFDVRFAAAPSDGGRIVGLTVTASSSYVDATPSDNIAGASLRVSGGDATDLMVTMPVQPLPVAGISGAVNLHFSVRNQLPGVAQNARMQILVDLPPAALSAVEPRVSGETPDIWSCQPPAPDGNGSRVDCVATAPMLQPAFPTHVYDFIFAITPPYRPGLPSYEVKTRIEVSSDSDEQAPADNRVEHNLTVEQSIDVISRVTALQPEVTVPAPARFEVTLSSIGSNRPRNPTARLAISGGIALSEITVRNSYGLLVACSQDLDGPDGPSLVCPVNMDWPRLFVSVPTRMDMVGSSLMLLATAVNDLPDSNADNNASSAQVRVVASADLCLGLSCSGTLALPNKLGADSANTLQYVVGNLGPSPVPAATLTIEAMVPPQSLAARHGSEACLAAVDIGGGRSRVRCELGALGPGATDRWLSIDINTTGLGTGNITGSVRISSDIPDPAPGNNLIEFDLIVVPVVNLSVQATVKPVQYPNPAEFIVTTGVGVANSSAPSELDLWVFAGWQRGPVSIASDEWTCASMSPVFAIVKSFHCTRSQALLPAGTGRLAVTVPASQFLQIGVSVSVLVQHRFTIDALAVDRLPADDWGEAAMVVNGRNTNSAKPPLVLVVDEPAEPAPAPPHAVGERRVETNASVRCPARAGSCTPSPSAATR